ncbi:Metal-dependent hydrolase YbeY, involved in rRNA and/or ribosome maturation and assembly [hydrothermal vent metagenome]|uniref:Metal-dependent hydrolase YbeY, involved in rRNA and/or ribosome maturation and assembly n=1 Tax=hydrothermal vent metagenome TaxID=652676 RepID=A0A3B0YEY5_9ZZZZ
MPFTTEPNSIASIEVQQASSCQSVPAKNVLQRWAQAALASDIPQPDLVIRVVDENESLALNSQYRGKEAPTNVLSFPFDVPQGVELKHLGDLVICAGVVQQEALQQGKPVEHHWAHMVVHGVLHLRGYDHLTEAQAGKMEALEKQILAELGITDPYVARDTAV